MSTGIFVLRLAAGLYSRPHCYIVLQKQTGNFSLRLASSYSLQPILR